ncbi:hypothetical protein SAMN05421505_13231 [Sinosporangium album]|uniref:Uncharacterized protein n=1 Tax=Sinosporangium album TaxID=504805 RepID=A0A1G8HHA2_9ACTN|nr:hypothetical protein [Sinosporangium album]SDI06036.1 hypothetical protein SAMN05421505_13231 [Sinosporangium album]
MTAIELEGAARALPRGRHARPDPDFPFPDDVPPVLAANGAHALPRHATPDDVATVQFPIVVEPGRFPAAEPSGPGGHPLNDRPDLDVTLALRRLRDAALQAVADIDIALR